MEAARAQPVVRGSRHHRPRWWLLAGWWVASVVAAVVHNGLWATPNLAFLSLISERLGDNPFTAALAGDYLLTDVSMTVLARLAGQTAPHEFARLHLLVLVLGWGAVVALAARRFGHAAARTLTVVLAASPLVTVSMQWLGQPDPVTGLCGVAIVLVRRRWTVFALALLAGLTHPEQAAFMVLVAAVARAALPPPDQARSVQPASRISRWRLNETLEVGVLDAAVGLVGVAAGRLLTEVYFRLADITVLTPRTAFLDYGVDGFLDHHTHQPAALLWTLWGPLWLAMVGVAVALWLQRQAGVPRTTWLLIGGAAVLALVPVAVTLDETRVYAVITAPLLAAGAVAVTVAVRERWTVWGAVALLVVTGLLPGGFATGVTSWRGQLDTPAMAAFLADGTVPDTGSSDQDLTEWLLAPFDFVIPDRPG